MYCQPELVTQFNPILILPHMSLTVTFINSSQRLVSIIAEPMAQNRKEG